MHKTTFCLEISKLKTLKNQSQTINTNLIEKKTPKISQTILYPTLNKLIFRINMRAQYIFEYFD